MSSIMYPTQETYNAMIARDQYVTRANSLHTLAVNARASGNHASFLAEFRRLTPGDTRPDTLVLREWDVIPRAGTGYGAQDHYAR